MRSGNLKTSGSANSVHLPASKAAELQTVLAKVATAKRHLRRSVTSRSGIAPPLRFRKGPGVVAPGPFFFDLRGADGAADRSSNDSAEQRRNGSQACALSSLNRSSRITSW